MYHFKIRALFSIFVVVFCLGSCVNKKTYEAPFSMESFAVVQSAERQIIESRLYSSEGKESLETILGYRFHCLPNELIDHLQANQISDVFQPSISIESTIRIGSDKYTSNIRYYFKNNGLSLIRIHFSESSGKRVANSITQELGQPQFMIRPTRKNHFFKYLWVKNGQVIMIRPTVALEDEEFSGSLLVIWFAQDNQVSTLCSMDDVDALQYAYTLKQSVIEAKEDYWKAVYDGDSLVYDRGHNHFVWLNMNDARDTIYMFHSKFPMIKDVLESLIIPNYYESN